MNFPGMPPVLRCLPFVCLCVASASAKAPPAELVGRIAANRYMTPTNQVLTPIGRQVELPGMRPQALALSPDGKILVTSGKTKEIVVIDPPSGRVLQVVALPSSRVDPLPTTPVPAAESFPAVNNTSREPSSQLSFTGLIFSPDGSRIYVSNVGGNIKVFSVDKAHLVTGLSSMPCPTPAHQNASRRSRPASRFLPMARSFTSRGISRTSSTRWKQRAANCCVPGIPASRHMMSCLPGAKPT